jgi:hypothetical protein
MFLRFTARKKNGKEHRYYSPVENRRVSSGPVVQRPVLCVGEINGGQLGQCRTLRRWAKPTATPGLTASKGDKIDWNNLSTGDR